MNPATGDSDRSTLLLVTAKPQVSGDSVLGVDMGLAVDGIIGNGETVVGF